MISFLLLNGLFLGGCSVKPAELTSYELGVAALQSGEWDKAFSLFSESIQTKGQEALGHRGQGLVYLEKDDYENAITSFTSCLDTTEHPGLNKAFVEDVDLYLAKAYVENGQPDKALTIYSQLLKGDNAGTAYLLRGKLYAEAGKFGQADQDFQRAVENNPSFEVYLQIYDLYSAVNRQADGAEYLRKAQSKSTESDEDAYQLGKIHFLLGDYDQAVLCLKQAIEGGVRGAAALLGRIYLNENNLTAAADIYQTCIDKGTEPAAGHNGLALCAIENGEYQIALQHIHEGLLVVDPDMTEALLFNEIVVYERQYEYD
ncbi:MAG: tetratricopeptide repeat protein, partial [Eubacterium sp.]|nr:tetratricopeptide repeat protein [Eubacterium sp.]